MLIHLIKLIGYSTLSNKCLQIPGVFKNKPLNIFFVFERAVEVEDICLSPRKAAGDKEENSLAQCSGAAGCLGQGDPGLPKDIVSQVTRE